MSNSNRKPDNHLVWAILSTLFCCLPLGIVSIIYASKVDGLYRSGDVDGAQEAADNAMKYVKYGVICYFIFIVLYVLLLIAGVAAGL